MAPVSAYPQEARRRAGTGTPTSGRHSCAVARRARRTSNGGMVRTATGTSTGVAVQVRDIPPVGCTSFARLRRAVPTGGRRSLASRIIPPVGSTWFHPPPAGGADRRSAFPGLPDHPAGWQYVVRPPPAGGADRRSAFPGLPDHPAGRLYVVRPPLAGGAGPHRENWPEVGVPLPPGPPPRSGVRGSPASGGRCRPPPGELAGGRRSLASRTTTPVGSTWFAPLCRAAFPGLRATLCGDAPLAGPRDRRPPRR